MVYTCCVKGCNTREENNIRFRTFPPISSPLFEQWKLATKNESLKNMDNEHIRKRKKVCNLHFPMNYRLRPNFCMYDFPMLMEEYIKVEPIEYSHYEVPDEEAKQMNFVYESNRSIINKLYKLDHTYCKTTEAEASKINVNDTNRITSNKFVNLNQSYSKTVVVNAKGTNIVDNTKRRTDNILVADIDKENIDGITATNIIDNSNRSTDNIFVNLDQSYSKTEDVKDEQMNIVDDSNLIIGNKLVNFYQSYGKSIVDAEHTSVDETKVTKMFNLNEKYQRQPLERIYRRKMQKRINYLEKLKEKNKRELKEFAKFKKLDPHVQNFFRSQLNNVGKKIRGGSYSFEDKIFALSIYRQSKIGYRFLLHLFKLPSVPTIMKFNSKVRSDPALYQKILNLLEQQNDNSGIEKMLDTYQKQQNLELYNL